MPEELLCSIIIGPVLVSGWISIFGPERGPVLEQQLVDLTKLLLFWVVEVLEANPIVDCAIPDVLSNP
jgi:hypothetical protein